MNSHGGNTSSSSSPTSLGSFLTPLLLSMTGIVATAFTIVAYRVLFVRFCTRQRRLTANDDPLGEQQNSRAKIDGVDEKVLTAIPVLSYSSKGNRLFRVDQNECAVCLGILEDCETVRLLPACRHTFHVPCIDQWLSTHNNCPVCRSPVVAPPTRIADDHSAMNAASCNDEGGVRASDGPPWTSDLLQRRVSLNVLMRPPSDSANQSRDMAINVEEEREDASESSSDNDLTSSLLGKGVVLSNSLSLGADSRQLDSLSSRLLRSFSQLSSRSRGVDANLPC